MRSRWELLEMSQRILHHLCPINCFDLYNYFIYIFSHVISLNNYLCFYLEVFFESIIFFVASTLWVYFVVFSTFWTLIIVLEYTGYGENKMEPFEDSLSLKGTKPGKINLWKQFCRRNGAYWSEICDKCDCSISQSKICQYVH